MDTETMMYGLSERLTSARIPVLRLHYSADPKKRPGTPEGDAWLQDATQGYPGGTKSPRWRKEMEIDYSALGGTKLFPEWEQWSQNGKIVVPPFTPTGYQLYGSYDHGWRHPACYLVHGVGGDGQIVTLWECFASQVPVSHWAKIIKGETVRLADGRTFAGNPFAGQETYRVADPSIWAEDQVMSDNTMKSVAKLYRMEGVSFLQGERGGDITVAEWLHGHWWADPLKPSYRITTQCPNLIRELGLQRHKEFSAQVGLNRSQPEELVDKDNDAFDAMKYFLLRFPPAHMKPKPEQKANSFAWWQKVARMANEGEAMPTFAVQREMAG